VLDLSSRWQSQVVGSIVECWVLESSGGQQSGVVSGRKDMLPYFLVGCNNTTARQSSKPNKVGSNIQF